MGFVVQIDLVRQLVGLSRHLTLELQKILVLCLSSLVFVFLFLILVCLRKQLER